MDDIHELREQILVLDTIDRKEDESRALKEKVQSIKSKCHVETA